MRRDRSSRAGALYAATIVVGNLIFALGVLSFWRVPTYVHYGPEKPVVEVRVGCIAVWLGFADQAGRPGFHLGHCEKSTAGGLRRERWGLVLPYQMAWRGQTLYVIPLWLPWAAVMLSAVGLGAYRRRRPPPGHCEQCGYNLLGNVSGVCPECGARLK